MKGTPPPPHFEFPPAGFNYYPPAPPNIWVPQPPFLPPPTSFLWPQSPPAPGFLCPEKARTPPYFPVVNVEGVSVGGVKGKDKGLVKKRKLGKKKGILSSSKIAKATTRRGRPSGSTPKFAKQDPIGPPVGSPSHSATSEAHGKDTSMEHSEMPSEVPLKVLFQMAKKKRTAQKKKLLSHMKDFSGPKPQQNLEEKETPVNDHLTEPRIAQQPIAEISPEGYASHALWQQEVEITSRPHVVNAEEERVTRERALRRCSTVYKPASDVSMGSTARTQSPPQQDESPGHITELVPRVHETNTPLPSPEVPNTMASEFGRNGRSAAMSNPQGQQVDIFSLINWAEHFDEEYITDNLRVEEGCHTVKANLTPLLEAITKKYGDIAKDCPWKSMRPLFLKAVCKILQGLDIPVQHLTPQKLKMFYSTVTDLQALGLNVTWLLERLERVLEVVKCVKRCKGIEDSKRKHMELLESTKKAFELKNAEKDKLESEIQTLEEILKSVTSEAMEKKEAIKKMEERCKKYRNKCLMDGLF